MPALSEFLMMFLSTAMGAGSALALGIWERRRDALNRERAAVSFVILDLHTRRALREAVPQVAAPGGTDASRVAESLLKARDNAREALRDVRFTSPCYEELRTFVLAVNRYLSSVSRQPERYEFALQELRQQALDVVAAMCASDRAVGYLEPGGTERAPVGRRGQDARSRPVT